MTAVGFEPTPLRTGALSQRLRPLGQTVLASANSIVLRVQRHHERSRSVVRMHGDLRLVLKVDHAPAAEASEPAGVVKHECAAKPTTSPTATGASRRLPV